MKIWAHRGCSKRYPENTITAFSKALEVRGLTGIELDIQMTKDNEIVVIHDERVDRTTDGIGCVKDFTYSQLRALNIETGSGHKEKIPSINEVLDIMQDSMDEGLLLNIELKNNKEYCWEMETKILNLIRKRGLQNHVIYSSFCIKSLDIVRKLEPEVAMGVLDLKASDCLYKMKEICGASINKNHIALHPNGKNIDLTKEQLEGRTVRAWFMESLYPEKAKEAKIHLVELAAQGITDVFLNEPEVYC